MPSTSGHPSIRPLVQARSLYHRELEYAKYQQRLVQGLAKKGAGPEEDAQKWAA